MVLQDPIPTGQDIEEEEFDVDRNLSELRIRVAEVVESRRLVLALPAILLCLMPASPICLAPVLDVDWVARATYMRYYYACIKAKRLQYRARAKLALRRSPELATKSIYVLSIHHL